MARIDSAAITKSRISGLCQDRATHAYIYLDVLPQSKHYFRALTLVKDFSNSGKSCGFSKDLGRRAEARSVVAQSSGSISGRSESATSMASVPGSVCRNLVSGLKAAPGIQQRAELLNGY